MAAPTKGRFRLPYPVKVPGALKERGYLSIIQGIQI